MTPDLEAIRARNEERRVHDTDDDPSYVDGYRGYVNGKRDDDYDREHAAYFESAITDIDTLLAEVERLRHIAEECECEHSIFAGVRTKQCAFILRDAGPDR